MPAPTATARSSSSPRCRRRSSTASTSSSARSLMVWTSCARWSSPRAGTAARTSRIWMWSSASAGRCETWGIPLHEEVNQKKLGELSQVNRKTTLFSRETRAKGFRWYYCTRDQRIGYTDHLRAKGALQSPHVDQIRSDKCQIQGRKDIRSLIFSLRYYFISRFPFRPKHQGIPGIDQKEEMPSTVQQKAKPLRQREMGTPCPVKTENTMHCSLLT